MKDTSTDANIFSEVLNVFDKFGLDLSTLCGIATDDARAMSGTGIGFVILLKSTLKEKNVSDNVAIFHCILHLQNLCGKSLNVMGPVIEAVNFIRARGLNHRQLQKFLDDFDTKHQDLAYFSEVRWLSKGSMQWWARYFLKVTRYRYSVLLNNSNLILMTKTFLSYIELQFTFK